MERELHRTGLANIATYIVLLALWAVMLGIIVLVVIDRTVLQRMAMLTDHIRSLSGNKGEVSCTGSVGVMMNLPHWKRRSSRHGMTSS